MKLTVIAITALLSGCIAPNVFYIGLLSEHDQSIFADAAAIEGVEVIDWPAPGIWFVKYGSPAHSAGVTSLGVIFIKHTFNVSCVANDPKASRDIYFAVIARHEIQHAQGNLAHSGNPDSVMHATPPCYPTD